MDMSAKPWWGGQGRYLVEKGARVGFRVRSSAAQCTAMQRAMMLRRVDVARCVGLNPLCQNTPQQAAVQFSVAEAASGAVAERLYVQSVRMQMAQCPHMHCVRMLQRPGRFSDSLQAHCGQMLGCEAAILADWVPLHVCCPVLSAGSRDRSTLHGLAARLVPAQTIAGLDGSAAQWYLNLPAPCQTDSIPSSSTHRVNIPARASTDCFHRWMYAVGTLPAQKRRLTFLAF
jgi:hypothetical protein